MHLQASNGRNKHLEVFVGNWRVCSGGALLESGPCALNAPVHGDQRQRVEHRVASDW